LGVKRHAFSEINIDQDLIDGESGTRYDVIFYIEEAVAKKASKPDFFKPTAFSLFCLSCRKKRNAGNVWKIGLAIHTQLLENIEGRDVYC
jgi:hypothetical protein